MNDDALAEYHFLKEEILKKIELHNTLTTLTITSVIAILAIILSDENALTYPSLLLLPLGIIIPMSSRIAYYRSTIAKISGYIIVNFERKNPQIGWETSVYKMGIYQKAKHTRKLYIPSLGHCYECITLAIICYIMYLYFYLTLHNTFTKVTVFNLLWPAILVLIEGIITSKMFAENKLRKYWIHEWEKIRLL